MSLELKSVSVMRGKATILKDISGRLEPGQIVGLIGPNGTGKSTLVNAIATLYPFGGTIHWKGRPVKLGEIGYMPQQCHVRADISVTETVLLGRHEGLSWRVDNAMVDEAISVLDEFRHRPPAQSQHEHAVRRPAAAGAAGPAPAALSGAVAAG